MTESTSGSLESHVNKRTSAPENQNKSSSKNPIFTSARPPETPKRNGKHSRKPVPLGRKISSVNVIYCDKGKSPIGSEEVVKRWTSFNKSSKVLVSDGMIVHSIRSDDTAVGSGLDDEDSVFYTTLPEDVIQTTQGICRDFICYRLKRAGFQGRVVITKYPPAKDQILSFQILKIGKIFEEMHPHLFRNLARQLGYVLRSNEEMRVLFERLAIEVVGTDPDEYRWGRILALLSIAGSLSVDCIAQGHVELIENVVTVFCEFVEANLLHWIIDHGGWDAMAEALHVRDGRPEAGLTSSLISSNFWVIALTGILVLTALILTMGALAKLFSAREFLF